MIRAKFPSVPLLAALLAAQLLLALATHSGGSGLSSAHDRDAPLLSLEAKSVDRIEIVDGEGERTLLSLDDGAWVLPEQGGFPADGNKVEGVIGKLKGVKRGLPVATTDAARARFKVEEEAFERRVTLSEGERPVATLYLGTSPGMRRIHARLGGETAIQSIALTAHDLPAKGEAWLDKGLLALPAERIEAIGGAGLTLRRSAAEDGKPAGWHAEGLAAGERLDRQAADRLAETLAALRFSRLASGDEPPEGDPVLTLEVTPKEGEALRYRLFKRAEKGEYRLTRDDRAEGFLLQAYQAEPLLKAAKRETLVRTETPPSEKDAG